MHTLLRSLVARRALAPALLLAALIIAAVGGAPAALEAQDGRPSLAEPSLSTTGEIAFTSGGDIWTVPLAGGDARLLVAHPATESRPLWSPDGRTIAFASNRTGNGDLYLLELASGRLRRLTYDDGAEALEGWSRDGRWLYFSSTARDIAGMNDIHRVAVTGGLPMTVAGDRYASEFFAAPAPDGQSIAISARGNAAGQWWRNGSSHLDESELWLVTLGAVPSYKRIGDDGGAKDMWPMWSPDGRTIFYMSDRSGSENLWSRPLAGGAAKQLTNFKNGRVLWPTIALDGRTIVFERDFSIWSYDVARDAARAVPITLRGAATTRATDRVTIAQGWSDAALSPDGKKIALVARGELWAADAKEGGDAERVTNTVAEESEPLWTTDSRRLVYVSTASGEHRLMRYDFATRSSTALTADGDASSPVISPDGKWIAFTRDGNELRLVGVDGAGERLLARGSFGRAPFTSDRAIAWSPDSRWIAFLRTADRGFTNAWVVAVEGGAAAQQVSFLGSSFSGGLQWSKDGTFLLYETTQRTEDTRLVRVDLVPRAPKFREDRFADLFKAAPASAARDTTTPRTQIVFEGIRQRATSIDPGIRIDAKFLSPDGKTLALISAGGGQPNLYSYSLDELASAPATARQLTTTPGNKGNVLWGPDSKEIWFTDAGRLQIVNVDSRAARPLGITAALDVDFHSEKVALFEQGWRIQRDWFYDPKMHGVDWNDVRARFAPQVAGAQTTDEVRRLLNLMVGELDASHSGAGGPPTVIAQPVGRLGVRWDRERYERDGTLAVHEIIANSPAAASGITVGQTLTAIEGKPIPQGANLDSILTNTVGRRVKFTFGSAEVAIRPISLGAEKSLLYRDWVESRRAYVAKISSGKLGYVHMLDMGAGSLAQLYVDLDAENMTREGVVIDIRNNNGGFVNAYALDVFARRGYLTMTWRGRTPAPARTALGQRALERPTALVINQHSLSDAEDFTEGYRALGLGPIIGEPTSGWIIYTSNQTLLDGSTSLRVPFIRIQGANGEDMERAPRKPDIQAKRAVGESYGASDVQLDAAVRELLKKVGSK